MTIGNYTYMVDYVFRLDGSIDVRAGATGTTLNRGIATNGADERFGGTVSPNISAPNHQHFFNFRIDFDVDGTANRLVEANTQSVPSAFGNAWTTTETAITTEGFRDINPTTTRHWAVESTTAQNALGEPTAYEIEPHDVARAYSELVASSRCCTRRSRSTRCGSRASATASCSPPATIPTAPPRARACRSTSPTTPASTARTSWCGSRRRSPITPGRGLPGHVPRDRRLLSAA